MYGLQPGEVIAVGLGFVLEVPKTLRYRFLPRSSTTRSRLLVTNAPVPFDSDYRGEAVIGLENAGEKIFFIRYGMRLVQLVFEVVPEVDITLVHDFGDLTPTPRGHKGLGSTGQ